MRERTFEKDWWQTIKTILRRGRGDHQFNLDWSHLGTGKLISCLYVPRTSVFQSNPTSHRRYRPLRRPFGHPQVPRGVRFLPIANQDKNEPAIGASPPSLSESVHILLRNEMEKKPVLENPDPVPLCSDESIQDVAQFPHPTDHPQQTLLHVASVSYHELAICLFVFDSQNHHGSRFNDSSITSQPIHSQRDIDRHQRVGNRERFPNDEGEWDPTESRTILETLSIVVLRSRKHQLDTFHATRP